MSLVKSEYEALLTLLNRVETKGLGEAKSLIILEHKLQQRIASWFDGHPTGFNPNPAPAPEGSGQTAQTSVRVPIPELN